jgi:hypothetical protein
LRPSGARQPTPRTSPHTATPEREKEYDFMTAHSGATSRAAWVGHIPPGVSVPFDSIRDPGSYVCNWNGHLLRVPRQALRPNSVMNLVGPEPLFVTKLSDDPDLSLLSARRVAERLHVSANF